MKVLEIRDFSQLDRRGLMDVYAESNGENIDYFYPDTTDRAAALKKIEDDFLMYIRDNFLQKEKNRYMVLERDGIWVSALRLYELEAGEYYIEALETRPDCRKQGFGSQLLGAVLERLKAEGPFRVRDDVNKKNTASLRTHEKCGFTVADSVGHDLLDGSVNERCYSMQYRYPREMIGRRSDMKKYDLAIFDLDGTILYTLEDLKNSLNYALSNHGFPERTLEEVRRFVGNGVRKLVERGAPAGTAPTELDALYETFHRYYRQHDLDTTHPYEGVPELMDRLRAAGMRLAVVSNKVDYGVKDLCKRFYPGVFDAAVGEKPGVAKKPAPDLVNAVLEELGISREKAVYIGDSEVDLQTAQNAGMDGVIVSWGFRTVEELTAQGATRIAGTPAALYAELTEP